MKRGEVWWVEFDPSVGSEIRKKRPAVIISRDLCIKHSKLKLYAQANFANYKISFLP